MKQIIVVLFAVTGIFLTFDVWAGSAAPPEVPVKGMVTMIDLGAKKCIPCKMMAPILEKLKKKYDDHAAIVFIDVWENPTQAKKYSLKSIPTQIFFDENGHETLRHIGFMSEDAIVDQLKKMGVN